MAPKGQVLTMELKRLLYDIRDRKPNVCVRFRRIGQMWERDFMQVVDMSERGAVFYNQEIEEFVYVGDLVDIMQFELDVRYYNYEPHFHYEVLPG